jgi:rhodanese-related sulfurtransferase
MKKMLQVVLLLATAFLVMLVPPLLAGDFPGRAKYPTVKPISTEELFKDYQAGNVVIVDVRSKIEYDVIHPKGASHIPVADILFVKSVQDLVAKNPGKKIVFYCNGISCYKSYEAAKKAQNAGVTNSYAYDAGIPEWVKTHPRETLRLGKVVVDAKKQIISESDFQKRTLPFEKFKDQASAANALVIDVRDNVQRTGNLPGLEKALAIPLDKFIPNFVNKKANQDKKLLIFDQVGKQVQWLEYYLVENGYKNYVFLAGGATDVLKKQEYK